MAMQSPRPWRAPSWLGPWAPKITRIQNMWTQPCDIPIYIWMAGYFAASPVLAFNILSPDCLDAAGERVRRGHHKGRKSVLRIADWATPLAPPNNAIGKIGFALYGMSQRIGWYMTLIDATEDWIIHGTSFAYQWTGCKDPNQGFAYCGMTNKVPLLLPATTSYIYSWDRIADHIFRAGGLGIATPSGHQVGIGFHIQQNTNRHPPLPDCTFECRIVDNKGKYDTGYKPVLPDANGNNSLMWFDSTFGDSEAAHNISVIVNKSYGVMDVTGTLTASGVNHEEFAKSACGSNLPGPT